MRTCEHFTSINLLHALFSLFCEHQHCEQWRASMASIGEDPHVRCMRTMLAACGLYARCKLWQAFYRAHIFIRVIFWAINLKLEIVIHVGGGKWHPLYYRTIRAKFWTKSAVFNGMNHWSQVFTV